MLAKLDQLNVLMPYVVTNESQGRQNALSVLRDNELGYELVPPLRQFPEATQELALFATSTHLVSLTKY